MKRRKFVSSAAAAIALAGLPSTGNFTRKVPEKKKMILSFYLDDTNTGTVKAKAFSDFTSYCRINGIRGEASFIPGYSGKSIISEHDQNQGDYLNYVKDAWSAGIDSHMEIMTHSTLFDFKSGSARESGIHEGLWLHEPAVSIKEYQDYFSAILTEADKKGIRFTGLTWPGCSCEACTKRYAELKEKEPLHLSQNAFQALLNLAGQNRFRNPVIPIFYESSETRFGIFKRASGDKCGVYDLMPNAEDHFGIWENSKDKVDPDYYITADGKSGIVIRHLENGSPYCMWYMHWQGVNPENGVGWEAFKTVTGRIEKYLSDRTVWMRPGDIVTAYHQKGTWEFDRS
jgi:hypothetical protein